MKEIGMENKRTFATVNLVLMALFAAATCVLAPLSVPIGPVPISLTNLVVFASAYVLGWKRGTLTYIVYLLIGLAGLPVFSGFTGGVGKLAGPTGGYLVGFIFTGAICGIFFGRFDRKVVPGFIGMILGMIVAYAFGTAWFCISTGSTVAAALTICVFPFIIGDIAKMVVTVLVGPVIAKGIRRAAE